MNDLYPEILFLRTEGKTYTQIACELGTTRGFVAGALYRSKRGTLGKPRMCNGGVPFARGEEHPCAKLSEEEVLQIRACDLPVWALAKAFKVSPTTVSLIRHRKRWAWL